jgi:tetratricopeptide (TPR) repeat protein
MKGAGTLLAEPDRTELVELIYDKWAKERVAAKDWAGAADVYAKGLAEAASSSLLRHNVVYLAQEWSRAAFAQGGVEGVIDVARQVIAKFPNVPEVKAGPAAVIANAVQERTRAAAFADAIATIERAHEVLDADRRRNLFEYSYNTWAKTFIDKKAWDEAIKIYDEGLAKLPDSSLLKQNRTYCVAQRSK